VPIRIGTLIAAVLAIAGTLAALAAHVAIDVIGDFALTHDAYDGVAHESRGLLLGVAVFVAGAIALRVVWDALVRRSGSLLAVSRRVRSTSFAQTTGLICVVTLFVLVAMELLDCRLAGVAVDGVSDLLGGSIVLGTVTAAVCGTIASLLCRILLAAIAAWEPRLSAWLVNMWCARSRGVAGATHQRRQERLVVHALPVTSTGRGTRAPPFPFPTA
jgi:hypothetical protein